MLNDIYHSLSPIAFSIGPVQVHWYGLSYIIGLILAAVVLLRLAKHWQLKFSVDALLTLAIACMIGVVVGARLGYVLIYGNGFYFAHPDKILALSEGGMSFHGGLIGLAVGLMITAKILKMPIMSLGDLVSISVPLAIFMVRCANFVNGELWGAPTSLPWGVVFADGGPEPRHPTQLYEALLEGVLLFIVLFCFSRRRPPLPRGSYFGIFMIGYGICRIAVEFVRQPDVQIGYLFGTNWVTMGMTLTLPMIVIGAVFLLVALKRRAPQLGLGFSLPSGVAAPTVGKPAAGDAPTVGKPAADDASAVSTHSGDD